MRLHDAATLFESHEFPISRSTVLAEHGDATVELPEGTETVTTVLERTDEEEYDTYEALREAFHCGLPAEAVGRRYYSDRDAPAIGEEGPTQVSF